MTEETLEAANQTTTDLYAACHACLMEPFDGA